MGSSLSISLSTLAAVLCCALFLILDATRYLLWRLSPVFLRRVTTPQKEGQTFWYRLNLQDANPITGALLQVFLAAGLGSTITALWHYGPFMAVWTSFLLWSITIVSWKMVFSMLSDDLAERAFKPFFAASSAIYLFLWPIAFPLRAMIHRSIEGRNGEPDEEEVSEEQIQAYIDVGEEEGILEKGEGKLLQSIVDFGDKVAFELMTPRIDILGFDVSGSLDDLAIVFNESKYSRIPIYEKSLDKIIGIVHVKEVFDALVRREPKQVTELVRPAFFVAESKKVSELLGEFQKEHLQIAIVMDEYGGTAGLVTIEDVIEEIVGEIADEHEDDEESVTTLSKDVYLVSGTVRVERLDELFDVDATGDDYETIAGLIFTNLGRVPKVGEILTKHGLIFEVKQADRKRIYSLLVGRDPRFEPETSQKRSWRSE